MTYLGIMEFESEEHLARFDEAQHADQQSQETMRRVRGPSGIATVQPQSIGVSIG